MKIAIIGSGGREHALAATIFKSSIINEIFCIPGNAGTRDLAENINIDIKNFHEILKIIKVKKIVVYIFMRHFFINSL